MTKEQLIVHTKYGACVWGETRNECSFAEEQYACGYSPPNYPVPAIPVRVGWQPTGTNECKDRPYWWVCSMDMLWTFWKDWGLVAERKDGIQIN